MLKRAVELVASHGPVPVVAISVGALALIALAFQAPQLPVTIVTLAAFGVTVYASERRARWTLDQRKAEFDTISQQEGPKLQVRIRRRIADRKALEAPDLFEKDGEQ